MPPLTSPPLGSPPLSALPPPHDPYAARVRKLAKIDRRRSRRVLRAIVAGRMAFSTPAEIAHRAGIPVHLVEDRLADLEAAGLVEGWDVPRDPLATLTPLGASRWRVRLVETGLEGTPRWADLSAPEPPPPRALGVLRSDASYLDELAGVDDDPAEIAAESEVQPGDPRSVPCPRCHGAPKLCPACR